MMSTNKMPVLCKFGGDFIWESNKVYYKGGTNRIVHVNRGIDYINLVSKVRGICKFTDISSIKYKYPGLDLDSLVSIENDDDVSNMMEAFPQSSEPIQLFVFCGQNLSIPTANPSFLMQNADNENDQASLRNFHQSNGTPAPFSHNTNVNNNNVPSASNDLRKVDCLLMDNQELHYGVVGSCVNDMPKITLVLKEGQEFEDANAFHKALREYAIRSNFEYKRTRSGGGRYQAKCIKDNCSWGIHAWKLPDKPTFKIKSLKGDHTCNVVNESTISNTRTHRQASRKRIADLEGGPVDTMTELKRQLGSVDHSGTICSPMKRHRTQGPISTRERKDKVGERISALQELISPFGKTDTASVLLEAMEYIKFLHDQVRVCCSAPYLQNTPQPMQQESEYYNLRSRGLCLVPVNGQ